MKHLRLISLFTVLVLMLTPLAVFAQDGGEMKEFTSSDGKLTLSYPADWLIEEAGIGIPFPGVTIGNSQETMDMVTSDENPQSGQQAILVYIMPTEFLSMVGMELPENPTVVDYAQGFGTLFTTPDEGPAPAGTEEPGMMATEEAMGTEAAPMLGEAEEVDLGNDQTAGAISVNDGDVEGVIIVRELSEGLLAMVYAATKPGEFNDDLRQVGLDVAATIQYSGTADDVMNYMNQMMSAEATAEPSDVNPATLDGNALVDERCTVCHSRERIDAQDKDEAGWTATVDRMISYGADLDSAERQAVIDYLVETH